MIAALAAHRMHDARPSGRGCTTSLRGRVGIGSSCDCGGTIMASEKPQHWNTARPIITLIDRPTETGEHLVVYWASSQFVITLGEVSVEGELPIAFEQEGKEVYFTPCFRASLSATEYHFLLKYASRATRPYPPSPPVSQTPPNQTSPSPISTQTTPPSSQIETPADAPERHRKVQTQVQDVLAILPKWFGQSLLAFLGSVILLGWVSFLVFAYVFAWPISRLTGIDMIEIIDPPTTLFQWEPISISTMVILCTTVISTLLWVDLWKNRKEFRRRRLYRSYMTSPEWQGVRETALERADGRCQICNRSSRLQAHHRTYKRLGEERPADVTILCAECHSLFHSGGRMPDQSPSH